MINNNSKKTLFYEQDVLLSKIIEANKELKFPNPQKNIYCKLLDSQLIDLRICYSLCKEQIKLLNNDMTMQLRKFLDKDLEYLDAQHKLNEEEKDSENMLLHNINLVQPTFDKIQVLFKYLFFLYRSIQDSIYAIYLLKLNQSVGSHTSMSDVVSLYFKPRASNKNNYMVKLFEQSLNCYPFWYREFSSIRNALKFGTLSMPSAIITSESINDFSLCFVQSEIIPGRSQVKQNVGMKHLCGASRNTLNLLKSII